MFRKFNILISFNYSPFATLQNLLVNKNNGQQQQADIIEMVKLVIQQFQQNSAENQDSRVSEDKTRIKLWTENQEKTMAKRLQEQSHRGQLEAARRRKQVQEELVEKKRTRELYHQTVSRLKESKERKETDDMLKQIVRVIELTNTEVLRSKLLRSTVFIRSTRNFKILACLSFFEAFVFFPTTRKKT